MFEDSGISITAGWKLTLFDPAIVNANVLVPVSSALLMEESHSVHHLMEYSTPRSEAGILQSNDLYTHISANHGCTSVEKS